MRPFTFAILFLPAIAIAAVHSIGPGRPVRFTAQDNQLLHASVQQNYADVPVDLRIVEAASDETWFEWKDELVSWKPENTQTYPGVSNFRSGLIRKGRVYEARATASGSLDLEFLESSRTEPASALKAGMSWLVRSADAWLANQPRRGAVGKQGQAQHPEAGACIACHITQFSMRGYFTAALNG